MNREMKAMDTTTLKTLAQDISWVRFFQGLAWFGWFLIGVPAGMHLILKANVNTLSAHDLAMVNHQILGLGLMVLAAYVGIQALLSIWNLDVVNHQDILTWRLKKALGGGLIFIGFETLGLINQFQWDLLGGYVAMGCALVYVIARLANRQLTNRFVDIANAQEIHPQKTVTWSQYQIGSQKVMGLTEVKAPQPVHWWNLKRKRQLKKAHE